MCIICIETEFYESSFLFANSKLLLRKHEFYWYQRWYLGPSERRATLGETKFSATKNPGLLETELLVCELETPRNRILRHIRLLLETEFSCSDLKLLETEL